MEEQTTNKVCPKCKTDVLYYVNSNRKYYCSWCQSVFDTDLCVMNDILAINP
jgi:endogenous inhibitor of DNA gyrase (YacG/DUF329 family)